MPKHKFRMPSKRLVLSYVLDWIVILAIAGIGGGFHFATPYMRPISLVDLNISYPYQTNEQFPTWLLVLISLIIPGALIFVVAMLFVPGPRTMKTHPWSLIWRRKFWEWNAGWMGLGLALASAFLITEGLKNIVGKPRPDLLARCQPDVDNIADYYVGGYGQDISPRWMRVSAAICRPADGIDLKDGFRSFPSGHSSFSWAGLLYLALFLSSKFAISIPFLPNRTYDINAKDAALEDVDRDHLPLHDADLNGRDAAVIPIRNRAAAPPAFLLALVFLPLGVAAYISASRFTDFRHHGFDIFSGSLIGIFTAWFSFRWYHLPIRQGAGWAWGARSRARAFGIGVGVGNYVGAEGWGPASKARRGPDVEHGVNGNAVVNDQAALRDSSEQDKSR